MLEIRATRDGSFSFAIGRIIGYCTESGKGSYLKYRSNSVHVGWDEYDKQIYFSLRFRIGRLRIKADI